MHHSHFLTEFKISWFYIDGLSVTHASLTSMPSQVLDGEMDPGRWTGIPAATENFLNSSKHTGIPDGAQVSAKE